MVQYRFWPSTNGPGSAQADGSDYTLGFEFEVDADATFKGFYWWVPTGGVTATTAYTFRLWTVTGPTTGSEITAAANTAPAGPWTANTWNFITPGAEVPLVANQRYKATVRFTATNGYSATAAYWTTGVGKSGLQVGPLYAPGAATGASNNLQDTFIQSTTDPNYPGSSGNGANYWLDVLVDVPDPYPVQANHLLIPPGHRAPSTKFRPPFLDYDTTGQPGALPPTNVDVGQAGADILGVVAPVNRDFESGIANWDSNVAFGIYDHATLSWDTTHVHSGTHALKVTCPTPSSGLTWANADPVTIPPLNCFITLRAWVYIPTGVPDPHIDIAFQASSPALTSVKDTWVQIEYTYYATADTNMFAGVMVQGATAGQEYWIDDVEFYVAEGALPVTVSRAYGATGSLTLSGSAATTANATASGSLTLSGSATHSNTATGSLSLLGSATHSNTATGSLTLSGSATHSSIATGSLTLSGTATHRESATGSLTLSGAATHSNTATGSLSLSGAATQSSVATGSLTLSGAATHVNTATGSLSLSGTATSTANATATGSLSLSGAATHVNTATGSLTLSGSATHTESATGSLTLSGSATHVNTATGSLTLSGAATQSSVATGSLSLSGSATAGANSTATGSLTLSGTATHVNTATGSLSLSGSATSTADATATGSLTLSGAATHSNTATGSLTLSGAATHSSTATGSLALSGSATAGANSTATGSLTLSGSATHSESATGSLTLSGSADTTADATATGSLTLSGSATHSNTATGSLTLTSGLRLSNTVASSSSPIPVVLAIAAGFSPSRTL